MTVLRQSISADASRTSFSLVTIARRRSRDESAAAVRRKWPRGCCRSSRDAECPTSAGSASAGPRGKLVRQDAHARTIRGEDDGRNPRGLSLAVTSRQERRQGGAGLQQSGVAQSAVVTRACDSKGFIRAASRDPVSLDTLVDSLQYPFRFVKYQQRSRVDTRATALMVSNPRQVYFLVSSRLAPDALLVVKPLLVN